MKKVFSILMITTISAFFLFSEQAGEIVYAEGDMFTIVSTSGERRVYEPYYDDVLGMPIEVGESILTEDSTYLEMVLSNSSTIIKIAENTTFQLESLQEDGGAVLDVAYGRIRAKVDKLTNDQNFWVTGYDTVAGIRGTDFGYDLFFEPDQDNSERHTSVYCFEGEVEVIQQRLDPQDIDDADKRLETKDTVVIYGNEMVSTLSGTPEDPLVKQAITQEVMAFWTSNDFVEAAPMAMLTDDETLNLDGPMLPQGEDLVIPDFSEQLQLKRTRYRRAGNIMLSAGIGMITGGVAAYIVDTDENQSLMQFLTGLGGAYVVIGGGLHYEAATTDTP